MKKRVISVILVLALSLSLGGVLTFADGTGPQTGLSSEDLSQRLQVFIDNAQGLIDKDDWENMEGAEKAACTLVLEAQVAEATKALDSADAASMESCLISLFGEWDAESSEFATPQKPYDDFKDALFLSVDALDAEAARGEKGYDTKLFYSTNAEEIRTYSYANLGRYSEESWATFIAAVEAIEKMMEVDPATQTTPLMDATRSQVAALLDTYYAAYDGLVGARRVAIYEEAKKLLDDFKADPKLEALYKGETVTAVRNAVELYEAVVMEIDEYSKNWDFEHPNYVQFAKLVAKQEQFAFGIQTALGGLTLIKADEATTIEDVIAVARNIVSLGKAYLSDQEAAAARLGYSLDELYMTGIVEYEAAIRNLETLLDQTEKNLANAKPGEEIEEAKLIDSVMKSIIAFHETMSDLQTNFNFELLEEMLYPELLEDEELEDIE